jgi:hypothetical protein
MRLFVSRSDGAKPPKSDVHGTLGRHDTVAAVASVSSKEPGWARKAELCHGTPRPAAHSGLYDCASPPGVNLRKREWGRR